VEVNAKTEVNGKPDDATPPQERVPTFVMRADSQTDRRLLREVVEDAPRDAYFAIDGARQEFEAWFRASPRPNNCPTLTLRADRKPHRSLLRMMAQRAPTMESSEVIRGHLQEFEVWAGNSGGILNFLKRAVGANKAEEPLPLQRGPSNPYQDKLRDEGATFLSLVGEFTRKREGLDALVSDLSAAQREVAEVDQQISKLKGDLSDADKALVLSGGECPEGLTQEEVQLDRAKRRRRLAFAKVQVLEERVAASEVEIQQQASSINTEFSDFGRKAYFDAVGEFNQAAQTLIPLYARMCALFNVFRVRNQLVSQRAPGYMKIENILARDMSEQLIITTEAFSGTDWASLAGGVPAVLSEMCESVEKAKKGST
jgi:hypothetical protein